VVEEAMSQAPAKYTSRFRPAPRRGTRLPGRGRHRGRGAGPLHGREARFDQG
jgi:hypothetical protein